MSALSFFRRNTKMVVGIMVGLMVAFVLSNISAAQWRSFFGMDSDPTPDVATLENYDITVSAGDVAIAAQQLKFYQQFGFGNPIQAVLMVKSGNVPVGELMMLLMQAKPVEHNDMLFGIEPLGSSQGAVNWALLSAEAKAQGYRADGAAVDKFLFDRGLIDENFKAVTQYKNMLVEMRKAGLLEADVRSYLADFISVVACFENSASGIVRSEPQLRQQFVDVNAKMNLAVASYDASKFLEDIDISETDEQVAAEVAELFAQCKQYFRDAEDNPTEFKFGYRLPQRVQLEYAFISTDDIAAGIETTDAEIHKFWSENTQRFNKTEKDEDGNTVTIETSYADVKSDVRKAVRSQKAAAQAKLLADNLIRIATDLQDAEDAANADAALAMAVEKASSSAISYDASGKWYTRQDITGDSVLASAVSSTRASLANAAFAVDAFASETRSTPYKVGRVVSQPFMVRGAKQGFVVWRVTAAVDSQAPDEMTKEIEADVRADWRLAKAYKLASAKASQAALAATKDSLVDVAEDDDIEPVELKEITRRERTDNWGNFYASYAAQSAMQIAQWSMGDQKGEQPQVLPVDLYYQAALSQPYVWSAPIMRELGQLAPVQREKFTDAAFALAIEGSTTTDEPAPAGTLSVVELPAARKVLLVQALSYSPAFEQDFSGPEGQRAAILKWEISAEKLRQLKSWCSTEQIELRTGFKHIGEEQAEAEEAETEG